MIIGIYIHLSLPPNILLVYILYYIFILYVIILYYIIYYYILSLIRFIISKFIGDHKKATIGKLVAEIIRPFLGPRSKVHSGVTDGGEITSIKHTAASLPKENKYMATVKERLCLCHQLNNAIKGTLQSYFGTTYIQTWRAFITRINFSNPFNEL